MRILGSPIYYGWNVLTVAAICELLAMGATAYAAGLFVLPMQQEFHISRAAANSPVIILYLGAAVVAPFVGRMLDRRPARLMVSVGAVSLGVALAVIAMTSSLLVMALMLFLPAAIGLAAVGPLMTQALVTRWFRRHRGLALGIAAVASSGGGFVVVPLLSNAIQAFGWRHGLLYEAIVLTFVIIGLAFFVLRNRPADMGLGEHPELQGQSRKQGGVERLRWREFLVSGAFWIPSLTLAGISGTSQATVITLVPYGIQLGFTPASAALLISVFSLSAAITKIVAGILADRVNQRILLVLAALFMTLSWLSLSLSATYGAIFAGACLAGFALGCALPTTAGLIATRFGPEQFGSVMGWTYAFTCVCAIASVLFAGSVFDRTHGYVLAFEVFLILMGSLAVATLVFARSARGVRI